MDRNLVPDEVIDMLDRVARRLRGRLVDGFPRTLAQAEASTERAGSRGDRVRVIDIEVPEDRSSSAHGAPGPAATDLLPPTSRGHCDRVRWS